MKELQNQGHECFSVISGWNDGKYSAKLTEAGIPHMCIKLGRFYLTKPVWNADGFLHFAGAARQLRSVIRRFCPDVVVLTSVEFAVTALQVIPKSVPVVLHVHDVPSRHWSSLIGRYVLARSRGIITVSDFIRDKVIAVAGSRISVRTVHNGAPSLEFVEKSDSAKLRIGIIGQLIARKKHDVLIDAVGLLSPHERAMIEVRIFGNDTTEYAATIRDMIQVNNLTEYFRWMGFVDSREEIYGDLDLVVAPAIEEPFGTTILEAGSCGLPVVAARSGGFPEMAIDEETGLLIDPQSPSSLATAISSLLNVSKRCRLGNAAKQHVRENFSQSLAAANFSRSVASFLNNNGAS
ncbi:glycosyltransferase involved in cell wall biosynthesis [Silicimonas algicola]|uniref:Glycosyltransferase involved in cell wall biosynthesis n=2 Tax=Silicimonas algicola TaxID=1826607 RepID=A0A316FZK3_9RHOB|nr:glycosyltransferase involved in cell wall biosynthesis [Silicimonas algicola]